MWPVMAQSHPWTNVPSVVGASTTVGIMKMQEWCVKVKGSVCMYLVCVSMCTVCVHGACVLCVYSEYSYCVYRECVCTMNKAI